MYKVIHSTQKSATFAPLFAHLKKIKIESRFTLKNKREKDRALAQYDIPFFGLKKGSHYFTYKIDSDFFASFEDSPIKNANTTVELEFQKNKDSLFELLFDISGTIELPCDRCLAMLDIPIDAYEEVLMKIGNVPENATDDELDIIYLSPDMTHYNVAQLIYEFIVLCIPIKTAIPLDPMGNPLCPRDANGNLPCDQTALQAIQKTNKAAFESELTDPIDPRWAALGKLKDEN